MIKVYNARDITEAQIVRGMLKSYGIEAFVGGQYLQGGVGELATMGFSTISVADEDVASARELILKYERDELKLSDDL